jgi:protein-S-isoprenylcysteine O-methyltransferase Ste14
MKQVAAWLGGVLFVCALAFCAWWYLVPLGRRASFQGWGSVLFDTLLFAVFALHHSVLARDPAKAFMSRIVPDSVSRTIYVWTASLLLIGVCVWWRPVGGEVYDAAGWTAIPHVAIQLLGLALIANATSAIDPLELAGIRAITDRPATEGLQTAGPYRWVRHPLYLGWVFVVSGHGHLTGDRGLFAVITTIYLVVAIPFEERSLVATFGDAYRTYQREVRWRLIPYVY